MTEPKTLPALALGAIALAGALTFASTAPADAAGKRAGRLLVKLEPGTLQPVFAAGPTGRGANHYVLDYRVSAATGAAVRPRLRLELRTETQKTYHDCYDPATWEAAPKALRRRTAPASTAEIRSADLAPGGAVDGLANFGAVDPNADDLEVRVHGLWDPVFRDRHGRTWRENRVLVLTFGRKGDEYDRQYDEIRLLSSEETVEGEVAEVHAK